MVRGPGQSYSQRVPCLPWARAQLQACSIPSRPQLCQGLHLVILFPCLGWLFTVPKQQKKAASKAKPPQQNLGQTLQHQMHGPAPVLLTISPTDAANFQITQENFKGKALPGAPEAGSSSCHSSSPCKEPGLSCFLFPMSRSSLQTIHIKSKEPGHPTPDRHLQSLLQKTELVWSEPSGRHEELFHPASPQLFYPSTFKNNGAIQLFKTKVLCFFPVVVGGLVCSCHHNKNKRPWPRATGFPHASVP